MSYTLGKVLCSRGLPPKQVVPSTLARLAKQIIDSCSKPVAQEAKDALREKIDSVKVLFEEKDSTSEST